MLKQKYFLTNFFILSAEKQPIKSSWRNIEWLREPNGVSINSFCIGNNIPYTAFYDWFKKTQKKVVPVEVEGIPEELIRTGNEERQEVAKDKLKRTTPHKGSIMVTIRTREGLCIQKKGLDYQGLKTLVEKLEGLC